MVRSVKVNRERSIGFFKSYFQKQDDTLSFGAHQSYDPEANSNASIGGDGKTAVPNDISCRLSNHELQPSDLNSNDNKRKQGVVSDSNGEVRNGKTEQTPTSCPKALAIMFQDDFKKQENKYNLTYRKSLVVRLWRQTPREIKLNIPKAGQQLREWKVKHFGEQTRIPLPCISGCPDLLVPLLREDFAHHVELPAKKITSILFHRWAKVPKSAKDSLPREEDPNYLSELKKWKLHHLPNAADTVEPSSQRKRPRPSDTEKDDDEKAQHAVTQEGNKAPISMQFADTSRVQILEKPPPKSQASQLDHNTKGCDSNIPSDLEIATSKIVDGTDAEKDAADENTSDRDTSKEKPSEPSLVTQEPSISEEAVIDNSHPTLDKQETESAERDALQSLLGLWGGTNGASSPPVPEKVKPKPKESSPELSLSPGLPSNHESAPTDLNSSDSERKQGVSSNRNGEVKNGPTEQAAVNCPKALAIMFQDDFKKQENKYSLTYRKSLVVRLWRQTPREIKLTIPKAEGKNTEQLREWKVKHFGECTRLPIPCISGCPDCLVPLLREDFAHLHAERPSKKNTLIIAQRWARVPKSAKDSLPREDEPNYFSALKKWKLEHLPNAADEFPVEPSSQRKRSRPNDTEKNDDDKAQHVLTQEGNKAPLRSSQGSKRRPKMAARETISDEDIQLQQKSLPVSIAKKAQGTSLHSGDVGAFRDPPTKGSSSYNKMAVQKEDPKQKTTERTKRLRYDDLTRKLPASTSEHDGQISSLRSELRLAVCGRDEEIRSLRAELKQTEDKTRILKDALSKRDEEIESLRERLRKVEDTVISAGELRKQVAANFATTQELKRLLGAASAATAGVSTTTRVEPASTSTASKRPRLEAKNHDARVELMKSLKEKFVGWIDSEMLEQAGSDESVTL